jgi:hypothetical protein
MLLQRCRFQERPEALSHLQCIQPERNCISWTITCVASLLFPADSDCEELPEHPAKAIMHIIENNIDIFFIFFYPLLSG